MSRNPSPYCFSRSTATRASQITLSGEESLVCNHSKCADSWWLISFYKTLCGFPDIAMLEIFQSAPFHSWCGRQFQFAIGDCFKNNVLHIFQLASRQESHHYRTPRPVLALRCKTCATCPSVHPQGCPSLPLFVENVGANSSFFHNQCFAQLPVPYSAKVGSNWLSQLLPSNLRFDRVCVIAAVVYWDLKFLVYVRQDNLQMFWSLFPSLVLLSVTLAIFGEHEIIFYVFPHFRIPE